jgi:nucleotide-binding universal stress UspA family protein
MQNILVASDFSDNSNRTLHYALELAAKNGFNVYLFHDPKVSLSPRTPANLLQELIDGYEAEYTHKLAEQAKSIISEFGINLSLDKIKYIVSLDNASTFQKINSAIDEFKIDLVFTGTRGHGGIKRFFLGSTALELMQSAACPVFAVPQKGNYEKIEEIVLATELSDFDEHVLKVIEFAKFFDAELFILHITAADGKADAAKLAENLKAKTGYAKINVSFLKAEGTDAEDEILNYLKREKIIDLLVMFPQRRGFVDRILGVGHTGNIISEISIPLLAFPSGEPE